VALLAVTVPFRVAPAVVSPLAGLVLTVGAAAMMKLPETALLAGYPLATAMALTVVAELILMPLDEYLALDVVGVAPFVV
jgi:hypothetical protein